MSVLHKTRPKKWGCRWNVTTGLAIGLVAAVLIIRRLR